MTRLAWMTDPHLVFLRDPKTGIFEPEFYEFAEIVRDQNLHGVLISGDISEAPDLVPHLELLDDSLGLSIYFVLGNHDFYRSSVARVRDDVRALCGRRPRLTNLSESLPVEVAPGVGLVGHDGFADGRYGLFHWSDMKVNDEKWIEDLIGLNDEERLARRQALGDEAARHLDQVLPRALNQFPKVIVLTHFPPFPQSALRRGKMCDDQVLPYYSCKAVGDALLAAAASFPDRELIVLCGHTHERCEYSPCPNVRVSTGAAEYGKVAIERVLEL